MSLYGLLGFRKVEFTSKDTESNKIYEHYYYWEWGFSIRIPFTKTKGEQQA